MMPADKLALAVLRGRGKGKLVDEVDAYIQQAGRELGETIEEAALVSAEATVTVTIKLSRVNPGSVRVATAVAYAAPKPVRRSMMAFSSGGELVTHDSRQPELPMNVTPIKKDG